MEVKRKQAGPLPAIARDIKVATTHVGTDLHTALFADANAVKPCPGRNE